MADITGICLECEEPFFRLGQKYCSRSCRKNYEDRHFVRRCIECSRTPVETKFNKHPKTRDGLSTICSKCNADRIAKRQATFSREERLAYNERRRTSPTIRNTLLVKQFGITLAGSEWMRTAQQNKCDICQVEFDDSRFPNVDHSHATGKVRGLLCDKCNRALGLFNDSIENLEQSRRYLLLPNWTIDDLLLLHKGEKRLDLGKLRQFKISAEGRQRVIDLQGGGCAICSKPYEEKVRFHMDHDHAANRVRGYLCGRCNVGLGQLNDDPALFAAAIAYLGKHTDI